jgi:8-oxo-dGTP pyrophosphatase MutT (NUDIX family)
LSRLRRQLSPVISPLFRRYWRVSRGMTLGARVIAQDCEGRVMLVKPSYRHGWELPGGGVESLETAEDAARRELQEEAGLTPTAPMTLFGLYANHAHFKNDHIALFHTRSFAPCPPEQRGEIEARGFFAVTGLPDDVSPGTRRRLDELASGAPRSQNW